MVLHEKSVMNSGLEHGQSFSHISVLDGIGLKKRKVFQHLWKYIFRNYDSVAERIKVTCCNRVIQWGVCFQLQNPVITGNSPLLLGLRKIVSALGLSFDIIEQGISALGSEFRTFSPGLSCLGLNSSSLSILDDLLFVY